ncbi:uncharacterized protein RJT21DRAFT_111274 [Scheffersomyces amazonensis]|uniref:uncharacterized protein n=1 Tax=Scheffersomyces amazonensis TaxID=1078765 RepID=UPI00315CB81A
MSHDDDDLSHDVSRLTLKPSTPIPSLPASSSYSHLPTQPQSPPVGSSHIQFGSDIHARLVAFQQKRSKPPPPPGSTDSYNSTTSSSNNSHVNSNSNSNSNLNVTNDNEQFIYNTNNVIPPLSTSISMINPAVNGEFNEKPLPPIPTEVINKRSFSCNDKEFLQGGNSSPSTPSLLPANVPIATTLSKKPSLSQRRGMKLNMNDITKGISPLASPQALNVPHLDFSTSSAVSVTTSSSSATTTTNTTDDDVVRKSSGGRRKPNFKLDLEPDGTLSRGNSINRKLDTPSDSNSSSNGNLNSNSNMNSNSNSNSNQIPLNFNDSEYDSDIDPPKTNGLFENYKKYIDIKSGKLIFSGKASLHSKGIDFSSGSSFRISLDELEYIEELGRGNYGSVSKVLHKPTGVLMAMKEVRLELDENKFTQILMELDILHKCDSPYIVDFYGAFFVEGAVYMCIEYMDGGSLDKIYGKDHGVKDETALAYITECVIRGLKELKDEHNIIHRDVKPTNILCNTQGKIKLCDFGVSGNLVSSLAKTNIGCQSYMAPERIKTMNPDDTTYSVQSDIWSLGLTILEIAEGQYPYPSETYDNIFSQLSAIVDGEPPKLDSNIFSKEAQIFVKSCLNKNPDLRPSYAALLNSSWLTKYRCINPHLDISVSQRLEQINEEKLIRKNLGSNRSDHISLPKNIETVQSLLRGKVKAPALHRGGLPSNKSFLNRNQ